MNRDNRNNGDFPPDPASRTILGDFIDQDFQLHGAPPRRGEAPWYRQAFQEDYLDIYMHRDLAEAARAVRFLAGTLALGPTQRLLDLCCGPGRHLAYLCNYVGQAVGLDLSRALLMRARSDCGLRIADCGLKAEFNTSDLQSEISNPQSNMPAGRRRYVNPQSSISANPQSAIRNPQFEISNPQSAIRNPQLIQADMRFLPLASASFDRVVNLFTSFGYFEDEAANAAVLREVARLLRPGGLLALDHINREAMLAHLKPRTERDLPDGRHLLERRRFDEAAHRVIKDIACSEPGGQVKGWRESVRVYEPGELEALLAGAGLEPTARHGDYGGGHWRPDSPRLILIARRRAGA